MSHDIRVEPARSEKQIREIARLARDIWYEYYVPLIGQAQVDYMLAKFQSVEAMNEQIRDGYEYFMAQCGDHLVGYLAVQPDVALKRLFISKLYVHKSSRGAGTGRACMEFIEQLAHQRGLPLLWLTVNKGNNSVKAYERLGFHIAEEIVIDIGNGFVMDDYRMEKLLGSEARPNGGVD